MAAKRTRGKTTPNRRWPPILTEAKGIAEGYSTAVTLRQLFYRLVSVGVATWARLGNPGGFPNTRSAYSLLSAYTSEERRLGAFPALSDYTRGVHRPFAFGSPAEALRWLAEEYRRDHTEGQKYQVWTLYEKASMSAQIEAWVETYGLPSAALRGYSSEPLEREVFEEMAKDGREAVVFYVGDHDPEGLDIERNFRDQATRLGVTFRHWERLAVLPEQITALGLVPNEGKEKSSRVPAFVRTYGRLIQVEVEAVDPGLLQSLVVEAITQPWLFDETVLDASRNREAEDVQALTDLADNFGRAGR